MGFGEREGEKVKTCRLHRLCAIAFAYVGNHFLESGAWHVNSAAGRGPRPAGTHAAHCHTGMGIQSCLVFQFFN